MPKYISLWEVESSTWPTDPKERAALMEKQIGMIKKALAEGTLTDWGIFPEGGAGYAIGTGSEADTLARILQYTPYIKSQVHTVLSIDDLANVLKSMTG